MKSVLRWFCASDGGVAPASVREGRYEVDGGLLPHQSAGLDPRAWRMGTSDPRLLLLLSAPASFEPKSR